MRIEKFLRRFMYVYLKKNRVKTRDVFIRKVNFKSNSNELLYF